MEETERVSHNAASPSLYIFMMATLPLCCYQWITEISSFRISFKLVDGRYPPTYFQYSFSLYEGIFLVDLAILICIFNISKNIIECYKLNYFKIYLFTYFISFIETIIFKKMHFTQLQSDNPHLEHFRNTFITTAGQQQSCLFQGGEGSLAPSLE